MMLDPIFRRVDESIENATRGASRLALVSIFALLALGFATAAAHAYATQAWGQIGGNMVIAGAFLVAALIVYFATASSGGAAVATQTAPEVEEGGFTAMSFVEQLVKPDADFVKSIGSSVSAMAPVAAKAVAERVAPNLHLFVGAAVGLLIASKLADKLDNTNSPEA